MTYNGKEVVSALHLLEKPKESDAVDAVDAMRHDEPGFGHTGPGSKHQQEAFERSRLDRVREAACCLWRAEAACLVACTSRRP
jgi:hypothetical protein